MSRDDDARLAMADQERARDYVLNVVDFLDDRNYDEATAALALLLGAVRLDERRALEDAVAVEREATRLATEKAVHQHRRARTLTVALAIATKQLRIVRESFRLDGLEVSTDMDKAIEVALSALETATEGAP